MSIALDLDDKINFEEDLRWAILTEVENYKRADGKVIGLRPQPKSAIRDVRDGPDATLSVHFEAEQSASTSEEPSLKRSEADFHG